MAMRIINLVEKNVHGAWVVYGKLGIRQYYGYTKNAAMREYRAEFKRVYGQFICQPEK